MLSTAGRTAYNEDHEMFRDTVRKVFAEEVTPNLDRWEQEGVIDRRFWKICGAAGLLCPTVPGQYGGLGLDFGYNAVVGEEIAYHGALSNIALHSDVICEYLIKYGTEDQKYQYLPKMVYGDCITAIGMTEPGGGSDLRNLRTTAVREGDSYILNGAKTYITNGRLADLIIVAARTVSQSGEGGLSLLLVDTDLEGFKVGRHLDKIGQNAGGTVELFFSDVRVPADKLLGKEGRGLHQLMGQLPQERLSIAIGTQSAAQRAFDDTVTFTKDRKAFGQTVFSFQNTRFELADMASRLQIGWAHLDWLLKRHMADELTPAEGAAGKLWHSEMLWNVVDRCLQLHGGAGYMNETPVARLWRDARVQPIGGGTSEIMKEVIGRTL